MAGSAVLYGSKFRVSQFAAQLRSAPSVGKHCTYTSIAATPPGLIPFIRARLAVQLFVIIHSSAVDPLPERRAISSPSGHRPFFRRPVPSSCLSSPAEHRPGRAWSQP